MSNNYIIPEEKEVISGDINFSEEYAVHTVKEDGKRYVISFEHYKKKDCEIRGLGKSGSLTRALEWFRDVGLASSEDEFPKSERIKNLGDYSSLYNGLTDEDVEIKEYKLSNIEGRIFYYVDEATKTVNCILIKNAHIELK